MNLNEMNFLLGSMEMYVTNEEEEKPITAHTRPDKTLSIKVHGVDIYQSCIDGLLPQQMLNDNIVTMLIGYVIYPNYLSLTLPFFLHCSIFFPFI
jgi:hypothetical protein